MPLNIPSEGISPFDIAMTRRDFDMIDLLLASHPEAIARQNVLSEDAKSCAQV